MFGLDINVIATAPQHQLWRLIHTLNKAEKRAFKLYATRTGVKPDALFLRLFDVLESLTQPDDARARQRLALGSTPYANAKRHLYQELLVSCRLIQSRKEIDLEIREKLDFAHVLYGKGLYLDALRILERVKAYAKTHHRDLLQLEVIEFQKLIEARHVTLSRQVENKLEVLLRESATQATAALNTARWSNVSIRLLGRYIDYGHSRNPGEHAAALSFYQSLFDGATTHESAPVSFQQRIHRIEGRMWYRYIQLEFAAAQEHALEAVNSFLFGADMLIRDPNLYLRSLYHAHTLAFLCYDEKEMLRAQGRLDSFLADEAIVLSANSRNFGTIYAGLAGLNLSFVAGDYEAAFERGQAIVEARRDGRIRPAPQRWGLILFKLAAAAIMVRQPSLALDYINAVLNMPRGLYREDLLINTLLLRILAHFDLANDRLALADITNLGRRLRTSREAARTHNACLMALRQLTRAADTIAVAQILERLCVQLTELAESDAFEAKALRYLDVRVWAQARLSAKPKAT